MTNAQQNLTGANVDKSKMSLSELASIPQFSSGTSVELTDAARGAREAQALEQKAEEARKRGDQSGAQDFAAQALEKRKSLGKFLRAGDSNPMASLEDAVTTAQAEADELGASDTVRRRGDGVPVGGWKAAGVAVPGVASAAQVSVIDNMRAAISGGINAQGQGAKGGGGGGGTDSQKLDAIVGELEKINAKFAGVTKGK